jgi:hypothetical protein
LIAAAALLHLALTLTVYIAGRFALLPKVFDRDGTGIFFATDGFAYRAEAIWMAELLTREGIAAWLATAAPFHVRAYSISFAVFGPLLGFNILSAEPLNILCYLMVLILVFNLGREVFDRRVGLIAAVAVGLWPSMLLHTTQLLRDPLFQLAMLALVLVCVTCLTRDYSWRRGLAVGIAGSVFVILLWLVRRNMWGVVPVVLLLGAALLVVRQVRERRIMGGNMVGVVLLLVIMACVPRFAPRTVDVVARPDGAPLVEKDDLPSAAQGAVPIIPSSREPPATFGARLWTRIADKRAAFNRQFPNAGSNIDADAQFNSLGDVIRYLPRALCIGLFAPFPNMWFAAGERAGLYGRLLSGMETLMMYVVEMLALVALWRSRRRLSAWLLLLIVVLCVTAIGLVVINVASLYRMRYVFWMLLIILGARGAVEIATLLSRERPDNSQSSPGGATY